MFRVFLCAKSDFRTFAGQGEKATPKSGFAGQFRLTMSKIVVILSK